MSVVPPENMNRLEHQQQQAAELDHDEKLRELAHEEHARPSSKEGDVHIKEGSNTSSEAGPDVPEDIVWTKRTIIATVALAGLYVGSQIPLYFVGGSLSYIAADIGGTEAAAWLAVAYALTLSAIAPFCGYMQDLLGRRNITLAGGLLLMIGIIVLATAQHFRSGVVAMSLTGAGAAIGELTALAGYV